MLGVSGMDQCRASLLRKQHKQGQHNRVFPVLGDATTGGERERPQRWDSHRRQRGEGARHGLTAATDGGGDRFEAASSCDNKGRRVSRQPPSWSENSTGHTACDRAVRHVGRGLGRGPSLGCGGRGGGHAFRAGCGVERCSGDQGHAPPKRGRLPQQGADDRGGAVSR